MSKRQVLFAVTSMVSAIFLFTLLAFTAMTPMQAEQAEHVKQATADPTVDVAVATLSAQTLQAASLDMTQAVVTAFSTV